MSDTTWTPDQPLRADATDEQIRERAYWLHDHGSEVHFETLGWYATVQVVHEAVAALAQPSKGISDAQCMAVMREFSAQKGESFEAMWDQMDEQIRAELLGEWRAVLECAALAQPAGPTNQADRKRCPCEFPEVEACSRMCSCRNGHMSGGCQRCCTYGSYEQQVAAATHLAVAPVRSAPAPEE